MRDEKTTEAVGGAAPTIADIDLSKLLGFQHIAADAADDGFVEEVAATFNKIGGPGEGPIIVPGDAAR